MKKSPRRPRNLLALLVSAGAAVAAGALTPTEWRYQQAVDVAAPGLVRVALPEATFDAAGAQQQDLRVLDAAGRETALLLDRPPVTPGRMVRPQSFTSRVDRDATVLILATGTTQPLTSVTLETPHPFFVRAVRVQVSADGETWSELDRGVPIFRQWGAEKLDLALGSHAFAWLRLTLDDRHGPTQVFTGAWLGLAAGPAPEPVAVGARISRREEYAGETVLTVTAAGRHLPLVSLGLGTADPLFMRQATVTVRELDGLATRERVVGSGAIFRVGIDGAAVRSRLEIPLNVTPDTAELFVHIHNGDSPPLDFDGVQLKREPLALYFYAPAAGRYQLLSGNAQAAAPHYDLAGLAGDLRGAAAATVVPGPREDMPGYRPRETVADASQPEVPLAGAPLDTKDWTRRKPVQLTTAGVQELELDTAVLAAASQDLADLRLIRAGNQVPYLLETPGLARALPLVPAAAPDPKRPAVSVWRLPLPHAGLPVRRLTLATPTSLFRREFRVYEKVRGADGRDYEHTLATGSWQRTPEPGAAPTRTFDFADRPTTDTLWLETDNGDNPALALDSAIAAYPVARVVFKAQERDGYELVYGRAGASAPRYDLGLVAAKLLTAERHVAALGQEEARSEGFMQSALQGIKGGAVFWGALALVVVVLLVVVARLLPKPAPPA